MEALRRFPRAGCDDEEEEDASAPFETAALALESVLRLPAALWVRSCCFMLSLRVNALWQVGQVMFFSPVCFLP